MLKSVEVRADSLKGFRELPADGNTSKAPSSLFPLFQAKKGSGLYFICVKTPVSTDDHCFAHCARTAGKVLLMKCISSLLFIFISLLATSAEAAEIELLSPTQELHLAEGDEFSFQELENRWDFNERRDIGYEEGFTASVKAENGLWQGIQSTTSAYVFPLFGGFFGALHAEGLPGDKELPRLGANHPIKAEKYYYLSYRLRHSDRSSYALYWNNDRSKTLWPDPNLKRVNYDGIFHQQAILNQGFYVYGLDLKNGFFDQSAGSWSGSINALRLDASIIGRVGSRFELDWMRLSDPNSAPKIKVSWRAIAVPREAFITVWLEEQGRAASPLARMSHREGRLVEESLLQTSSILMRSRDSLTFPSAMLPPGNYRLFITAELKQGAGFEEIARSTKSALIKINAAASAVFSAPSQSSGASYASKEAGNAWDMSEASDLSNLQENGVLSVFRQFSAASFVDGVFQALTDEPLWSIGNRETDAQVHLNVPASRPISSAKYRYLSYRIGADESLFPTIADKVREGWVTRPVFWNKDVMLDGGSLKAHVLYEGMKTYTIDLWEKGIVERGIPWLSLPNIRTLRLDPLETSIPTWFFLDKVTLSAPNMPSDGSYLLEFEVNDEDDTSLELGLYYSRAKDSFKGTLIKTLANQKPGKKSFLWDTSKLAAGEYYPYLRIRDGQNTSYWSAAVPVIIGGRVLAERATKAPLDYDGDGRSDFVIYRPQAGAFFSKLSGSPAEIKPWGGASSLAVAGDFDGDLREDYSVVFPAGGSLHWFIIRSSDGSLYYRTWGVPGDSLAVADWNGDFKDDIAVFRNGSWFVLFDDGSVRVINWGQPGDIPVAADYDLDGIADAAIFRPADGTWWALHSSGISPGYQSTQWGLPGDVPLAGNSLGDGRSDFNVWRPATGTWYLKENSSIPKTSATQWGLPGDKPLFADFNGDGQLELVVWRPLDGTWYVRGQDSQVSFQQWGLPEDYLPGKYTHHE